MFKAKEKGKCVSLVNESFTTQTCSFCGNINKPGCSKIYSCVSCKIKTGRDVNASKNILMKGILSM
jgi:transposase